MKKIEILTLCLVIVAAGCSVYHVHSQDMTSTYYPSKDSPNDVAYIENVRKPHEVIGLITVNSERRQRISDIIQRMKHEAAILGADAITNIESDATGQWKKLPAQQIIGNAYIRANYTANAVVFK